MSRFIFTSTLSLLMLLGASDAFAVKVNSYTFNDATAGVGGITDSIGGQHGTLVDPAGTYGTIAGGRLNLTANNGASSNQATEEDPTFFAVGAYVDLPDAIANTAINSGNALQVSFETWFTTEENRNWSRVWDFGTSNLGEDAATSGNNSDFIAFAPQSGSTANGASIESGAAERLFDDPTVTATAGRFQPGLDGLDPAGPAPLAAGVKHHVVVSIIGDSTDGQGGTIEFFLNGVSKGMGALAETLQIGDLANITGDPFAIPAIPDREPTNNWLGRSNWGDVLFDGYIDEFNIYDTALNESEAASMFAAGPLQFDMPTVIVDRATGEITVANDTGAAQELSSLTFTSAIAGLTPAGLTAPSDFEVQTPATSDTINLEDANGTGLSLSTDGTPVSLGAIWQRSPYQDLAVNFALEGSESGAADIIYTGDAVARSDFDLDGDVDLGDYAVFLANAGSTVSGGIDGYFLGDIDLSGMVDRADFRLFKTDYFAAGGSAAALASFSLGAVPEPTSLVLLVLGAVFPLPRRHKD